MRILAFIGFITLLIAPFAPAFAQSQSLAQLDPSQEVKDAKDKIIKKVVELREAKEEGGETERDARFSALVTVVEFSITETEDLLAKLDDLNKLSDREEALRDELKQELEEALIFQKKFLDGLNDTPDLTLEDVKALAGQFKDWRESVYAQLITEVINFIMVFHANDIVKIGENRFDKLLRGVHRLKSSKLIKVDELEPLLNEAGVLIAEARLLHTKARDLLFATSTEESATTTLANDTIFATSTSVVDNKEYNKESGEDKSANIRALIEEAMLKVREAYDKFLKMSKLVRKMLDR